MPVEFLLELCRIQFLNNHISGSLAIFGKFSGIETSIETKWIGNGIEKEIIFWFTIPHCTDSQKESGFTIPDFDESTWL